MGCVEGSKIVVSERRYAWMFTALVVFLPGNVILYSYVNCDALAMCSTAIIFLFLGQGV